MKNKLQNHEKSGKTQTSTRRNTWLHTDQGGQPQATLTWSVGRSMKTCRSSRPGLSRALSKMSARLVAARTMTWSVVPIPKGQIEVFRVKVPNTVVFLKGSLFRTQDRFPTRVCEKEPRISPSWTAFHQDQRKSKNWPVLLLQR